MRRPGQAALLLGVLSFVKGVQAGDGLPTHLVSANDGAAMVLIPAGEFYYGEDPQKRLALLRRIREPAVSFFSSEARPEIKRLGAYYIDRFEVTNEQYARFLRATGHRPPRY